MNRVLALPAMAVAVAALAVACSSSTNNAVTTPASASGSASSATASTAALHTASTKYGTILVDGSGRTLYLLTADTGGKSSCYGTCATYWPPSHTTGTPSSSGVTASMVGTTARTDNTTQITYHGHPLYTFIKDTKAGDVTGEGVTNFGGTWYVVGVNGNPIMSAPASTAPSSTGSMSTGSTGGGYGY